MAWLSRVNFVSSDTLSFTDINNLGNDIRAWGDNVNGGGYTLSNVVLSASAGTMPTVTGGSAASSTLTLRSTSGAGTTDAIIFQTGAQVERARITSVGRFGVATNAPDLALHVVGTQGGPATSGTTPTGTARFVTVNSAMDIGSRSNGNTWMQVTDKTNLALSYNLELNPNGGNVGIGTASPLTKLQVGAVAGLGGTDGNVTLSAGTNMIYATAISGAALTWNANTNSGFSNTVMAQLKPRQDTSANYNLDVFCGTWNNNNNPGTAVATFQSTGNVGIGTSSPATRLHVLTANPTAANEVARFQGGTNNSNFRNYISCYTTNTAYWWELSNEDGAGTGSSNGFAFRERSAADPSVVRLYLASGGNVGIGTTTPATSAKLEIAGTTGALLVPRLTTTERNALTAVNGMIIYNTTDNQMQGRINGAWVAM